MKKYIRSNTYEEDKICIKHNRYDDVDINNYQYWTFKEKETLAKHARSYDVLKVLSKDPKGDWIRYDVANNKYTDASILEDLAIDESDRVRAAVARNHNTPESALCQLVYDKALYSVAQPAIQHLHTVYLLNKFAASDNDIHRFSVACNPNTPLNTLIYLAKNDEDKEVRETARDTIKDLPEDIRKQAYDQIASLNAKKNKWPSASKWQNIDSDEQFEEMWSSYLSGPEDEVNKVLQIFPEPSVQGGSGGMFIHDESGKDNESIVIDYRAWCDVEQEMAVSSKSAKQYKEKYKAYIESLIAEEWG